MEKNSQGTAPRPLIGIGVMIENSKGELLLGLRKGAHGAGQWCFPGGHLEFSETIFETAAREVKEETGLEVGTMSLISVVDETPALLGRQSHYVTIGVKAAFVGGEPRIMEPEKCGGWRWFFPRELPSNVFAGSALILRNYQKGIIYDPVELELQAR